MEISLPFLASRLGWPWYAKERNGTIELVPFTSFVRHASPLVSLFPRGGLYGAGGGCIFAPSGERTGRLRPTARKSTTGRSVWGGGGASTWGWRAFRPTASARPSARLRTSMLGICDRGCSALRCFAAPSTNPSTQPLNPLQRIAFAMQSDSAESAMRDGADRGGPRHA